jgi:hypothetical protein
VVAFDLLRVTAEALMNGPARSIAVLVTLMAIAGCSPKGKGEARVAANNGKGDVAACSEICEASAACGDAPDVCRSRCNEWLVKRSRPGIAGVTAKCAVPRIDNACETDASRAAAKALVSCVDDAGRAALAKDKSTLLVAARAICERGARCGGGAGHETTSCVERITKQNPPPRGLGIFGAMRPEIVNDFASCMKSSECGAGGAVCFGEMLGESGEDSESPEPSAPPTEPVPSPAEGGAKI